MKKPQTKKVRIEELERQLALSQNEVVRLQTQLLSIQHPTPLLPTHPSIAASVAGSYGPPTSPHHDNSHEAISGDLVLNR